MWRSAEPHCTRAWMSISRPTAAGDDAPLISERAATRGRSATGGGDARARVSDVSSNSSLAKTNRAADRATRGAHARRRSSPDAGVHFVAVRGTAPPDFATLFRPIQIRPGQIP
jgi:hypothetical protein